MGRKKNYKPEHILDVAMHEFWTRGYHSTSIPTLEAATGISRQSIYDSFKSKRALFLLVLKYYQKNVIEKNLAHIEHAASPKQAVCEYFAARAQDALRKDIIKGCLLTNTIAELAQHDVEVREQTNITLAYMKKVFQDAIIQSKNLNEISKDVDTESTAEFLVNSAQGLFILSCMNTTKSSVNSVVMQIESLLQNTKSKNKQRSE